VDDREGREGLPEFDAEVEAALASVARPSARPEFESELKRRFLSSVEPTGRIEPASSGPRGLSENAFSDAAAARRRVFLRIGGLIAAGLILTIGFVVMQSAAPRWRVLDLEAGTVVKLDGKTVPSDDRIVLARALQRAREIEVEKGDLVLQIDDLSLFDLGPGTRVAFGEFDRHASGASFDVRALAGRLRARTGPGFLGRTMKVTADVMEVTVTGTAFAVDYEPHGTCICCLKGDVHVASKAIGPNVMPIPPERMCLVYRDAREPKWGAPPERHAVPLEALERRAHEIWP
jgi:ferric-dicitrate binding protein FerR (iron transport regulator)